jgi:hypothetical protein
MRLLKQRGLEIRRIQHTFIGRVERRVISSSGVLFQQSLLFLGFELQAFPLLLKAKDLSAERVDPLPNRLLATVSRIR